MAAPWVQGPSPEGDRAAYSQLHVRLHDQVLIVVPRRVRGASAPTVRAESDAVREAPMALMK